MDIQHPGGLEGHFLAQILHFPTVVSICYADEQAEYVGAVRKVLGVELGTSLSSKATGNALEGYEVDSQGHHLQRIFSSPPGYDPRLRPWYQAAVQAKGPAWTPVYVWSSGDVGLDAVVPVYGDDARLVGVLDTSLTLNEISEFLAGLHATEHARIFIMERSGLLVASSTMEQPYTRLGEQLNRLPALDSSDGVVRSAVQALTQRFGNLASITGSQQFYYNVAGKRQFAQVVPYRNQPGLDWLMVVVIPEADFMGQVEANNRCTVAAIVVSLLAAILLATLLARWVTGPLARLNRSAKELGQGDLARRVAVRRRDEIGQLAASFNRMAEGLQASFASLQASEERFQLAFENAYTGMCLVGLDGRLIRVNGKLCECIGYSREELEQMTVNDLVYPEDRDLTETFIGKALAGESEHASFEQRYRHRQGDIVFAVIAVSLVRAASGDPSYFVAQIHDVTDRKRSQEALERSEERFAKAFRASPAAMAITRLTDGRLLDANQALIALLLYRREELVGRTVRELGIWTDEPDPARLRQILATKGLVSDVEWRFRAKDGRVLITRVSAEIIKLEGEPCILSVIVDYTERLRLEAQLRASEERYRSLIESQSDLIVRTTADGHFTFVNDAFCELLGRSREELLGHALAPCIWPEYQAMAGCVQQARLAPPYSTESETQYAGSRGPRWFSWVNSAIVDDSGQVVELQRVGREITAAKQAQELSAANEAAEAANRQLKELNQLKNQFVSNVSHELRTPLTNIKTYLSLLKDGKPEKRDRYLATLKREADRLQSLIEDLLQLSRLDQGKAMPALQPLDVNAIVTVLAEDRSALFSSRNLDLEVHTAPALPTVLADRNMLVQVLTNLMTNAMNYTPSGGRVAVSTGLRRPARGEGNRDPAMIIDDTQRPMVVLLVADTGPGISDADRAHLFDRFFRGEAAGKSGAPGTGLGLAICQEIVSLHGGHITVESQVGQGSCFTVWLPAMEV